MVINDVTLTLAPNSQGNAARIHEKLLDALSIFIYSQQQIVRSAKIFRDQTLLLTSI